MDLTKWHWKPFDPPVADGSHKLMRYPSYVVVDGNEMVALIPVMRLDEVFYTTRDVELLVLSEFDPPIWRPFDVGVYAELKDRVLEEFPLTDPKFLEDLCEILRDRSTDTVKYSLYEKAGEVLVIREELAMTPQVCVEPALKPGQTIANHRACQKRGYCVPDGAVAKLHTIGAAPLLVQACRDCHTLIAVDPSKV